MHGTLTQLAGEFGSLKRRAQGSAAAAYYGLDKEKAVAQMMALADRISDMQQVRLLQDCPSCTGVFVKADDSGDSSVFSELPHPVYHAD